MITPANAARTGPQRPLNAQTGADFSVHSTAPRDKFPVLLAFFCNLLDLN